MSLTRDRSRFLFKCFLLLYSTTFPLVLVNEFTGTGDSLGEVGRVYLVVDGDGDDGPGREAESRRKEGSWIAMTCKV